MAVILHLKSEWPTWKIKVTCPCPLGSNANFFQIELPPISRCWVKLPHADFAPGCRTGGNSEDNCVEWYLGKCDHFFWAYSTMFHIDLINLWRPTLMRETVHLSRGKKWNDFYQNVGSRMIMMKSWGTGKAVT